MKIFRTIAFLFVMVFMACPALMADSYEKLWKQAKELNEKNLTRSAYDVALKIYEKAVADNEKGQMLATVDPSQATAVRHLQSTAPIQDRQVNPNQRVRI